MFIFRAPWILLSPRAPENSGPALSVFVATLHPKILIFPGTVSPAAANLYALLSEKTPFFSWCQAMKSPSFKFRMRNFKISSAS